MPISALKHYQRPRGAGRFDDLPPDQRAAAEAHFHRLCSRWGDDLPQWRRAILVGRAKDLVLRPRDASWGRALRKGRRRQPAAPAASPSAASAQPAVAALPDGGASPPAQVASSADGGHVASYRARTSMASRLPRTYMASSSSGPKVASSVPESSRQTPPSPHAVRLDIRGLTARGTDGQDSAQRILRDLELHLGQDLHFSLAVPAKDLPPGWAWRLEVVPVR